tara:strand:- start:1173 stop:2183 length:1011 start_codon:yes stop_codon:yes gene_type:complete
MSKIKIIAEIGVNHNGRLEYAKKLIDHASNAKADYVKFQSYITSDLVHRKAKLAGYQKKNNSKTQYELLKKYELSFDQQKKLLDYSKKKKIKFLSSPFDIKSCQNLKKLGLSRVKIPSGEITNFPMLEKISQNFKEIFLSTGMATLDEIKSALKILKKNKKKRITLMHCTSLYPTSLDKVNLNFLNDLKLLNCDLGFSDHTVGQIAGQISLAYGVSLVEKHITLSKKFLGPDHSSSMEPNEFKSYVFSLKKTKFIFGNKRFERSNEELRNKKVIRKSIFASKNINKNEKLNIHNICTKRPETYLPANNWYKILGRRVKRKIRKGDPILRDYFYEKK